MQRYFSASEKEIILDHGDIHHLRLAGDGGHSEHRLVLVRLERPHIRGCLRVSHVYLRPGRELVNVVDRIDVRGSFKIRPVNILGHVLRYRCGRYLVLFQLYVKALGATPIGGCPVRRGARDATELELLYHITSSLVPCGL